MCLTSTISLTGLPAWRASPQWSRPIPVYRRHPDELARMSNVLNTKPELLLEFWGHLEKPGGETVVLFLDCATSATTRSMIDFGAAARLGGTTDRRCHDPACCRPVAYLTI
jgi:hypothetical protein